MDKRLKILMLLVALPLLLISCKGKEPEQNVPIRRAPAPPKVVEVKPVEQEDMQDYMKVRVQGQYRNPFQSYMAISKGRPVVRKIRGPLECCELGQFKLIAVVAGKGNSYALIHAPNNKRYVVKRGDVLGLRDGRIIKIYRGGLTVREYTRDEEGNVVASMDTEVRVPTAKRSTGGSR